MTCNHPGKKSLIFPELCYDCGLDAVMKMGRKEPEADPKFAARQPEDPPREIHPKPQKTEGPAFEL